MSSFSTNNNEHACICLKPLCGCSDPSVAVCRRCGGRVSLRKDYEPPKPFTIDE